MTPTLRISGVGKRFELGERVAYRVLSDALRDVTARAGGRLTGGRVGSTTQGPGRAELWALRDVSLDVEAGEVVGIIGQNGAGKSTLLKILSRITPPTEGRVEVCGRMGSLLEVGTGFHPELTGRENIYLNGIIMGMTRREVDRKFDEIVDFAQVEAFLDTPVKRYSSGMHVRLGFAVAANLEPEILIVDEVLAVGDADFQRKCLARLHDTAKSGRTVLFVSHNMNAVQRLCTRCVLLAEGRLVDDATPSTVVAHYLSSGGRAAAPGEVLDVAGVARRRGGHALRVVAASYASPADAPGHHAYTGGPLNVTLALESDIPRVVNSVAVILYDQAGVKLVNADTLAIGETLELRGGTTEVRFEIAALHLNPGTYTIGWWVADAFGTVYDFVDTGFRVEVLDSVRGFGVRPGADGVVECAFGISRLTEEGRLADGARIRAASAPEAAGTPPAQRD